MVTSLNVNGNTYNNVQDALTYAGQGWKVQANGGPSSTIKPGDTVNFVNGSNTTASLAGKTIKVDVVSNPTFTGMVTMNGGMTVGAGQTINMGGNQVHNVAAGTADTDAVNVSQLNAKDSELTSKGLNFAGNSGANVHRDLGQTLAIQGAATTAGTYSGGNLKTVTDPATGAINLQMADAPKFGTVTINDGGSGKITGVTAGVANTDAVNVSQLKAVDDKASLGWNMRDANGGVVGNVAPGDTVKLANGSNTKSYYDAATQTMKVDVVDAPTFAGMVTMNGGMTVGAGQTINMGGNQVHNVAAGAADTDAVNVSQLNAKDSELTSKGLNFAGNSGANVHRDLGQTLAIQGAATTGGTYSGGNLKTVTDPATGAINLQMADAPKFGTVTINDGGSGKITGVTAGVADTDAVNVSQLTDAMSEVSDRSVKYKKVGDQVDYNTVVMEGDTYNSVTKTGGTKITNVARGVDDSDAVNMSQLNETNATINNFAGDQSDSYTTINGRGIRYVRTNDDGLPLDDAYAKAAGASALGYNAMALGVNSLAMGRGARANFDGDVALGSGSKTAAVERTAGITIAGNAYTFAGATPSSTVSVGDVGAERTITNVAAGRITAESTDAINGSQLYAANQAIEQLDAGTVKYQQNADGTFNYNKVIMQGDTYNSTTKTGGTRITNVAAGVDGGDAVNVDQLNVVKQDVTNVTNTVNNFAGNQTTTFTEENGRGIKYVRTNDTGLVQDDAHDAHAQGTGSTAVGYNATASGESSVAMGRDSVAGKTDAMALGHNANASANEGDVALGSGSKTAAVVATEKVTIAGNEYAFAGTNPTSTVSVGDVGAERTITNVAAGRITAESTDAINGSQLNATNLAIEKISSDVSNLDAGSVKYEQKADGTYNYNTVVMQGDTYNSVTKTGGTKITNIARGVDDSDAVNMSQLNETNQAITNVSNTVNNFAGDQSTEYTEKNGRGIRYVRTNDTGLTQSDASAQGQGSTAVGYDAKATGESALALGRNAQASEANSVALGSGSKTAAAVATASGTVGGTTYQFAGAKPTSTVSVGDKGAERTVTHVAAGRISAESTDAINGSQLYATNQKVDENTQAITNLDQRVGDNTQSINNLNNKVDGVKRDANAGSASAMAVAGLPQAVLPGKGMVAMAGSTYGGESALALGVSKLSDSGKWVFKGGVTTNTRGNVGATIGAGFHW
ncbi:hypothetical protein CBM2615_B150112 [Cupriavidus taiwanensis]|uniref:Uncharacterized protein n=1 Tax=Cupriavidus taiwanensis TaxID=164546 RepID=A0A976B0R5_9BURK|nr:hypothetical protein CBM2614_B160115 [Cupriavidus taiwanensis]SOZ65141.1 hypothetical protein CBM2615_B150112 [Cupriavidus taiwanensis]SOZ68806.1 hypothetical protein CBM2613_B120112 [Cupriavidus taiwanensis]